MNDYILIHHGIKGQKWGVRRFQNKDGSLTAKGKNRYGSSGKGKRPEDMTDEELDQSLKRLRKEDEYNRLMNNKKNYNKGKSAADRVIKAIGTTALVTTNLVNIYKNSNKISKSVSDIIGLTSKLKRRNPSHD